MVDSRPFLRRSGRLARCDAGPEFVPFSGEARQLSGDPSRVTTPRRYVRPRGSVGEATSPNAYIDLTASPAVRAPDAAYTDRMLPGGPSRTRSFESIDDGWSGLDERNINIMYKDLDRMASVHGIMSAWHVEIEEDEITQKVRSVILDFLATFTMWITEYTTIVEAHRQGRHQDLDSHMNELNVKATSCERTWYDMKPRVAAFMPSEESPKPDRRAPLKRSSTMDPDSESDFEEKVFMGSRMAPKRRVKRARTA